MSSFWPLAIFFAGVLAVVAAMMVGSWLLGQRHRSPATDSPYESGMIPTGSARLRLSVQYYLVAVFFVVFDLEAAYLYAWAVAARHLGWNGFIPVVLFTVLLLLALGWLWRSGALDWGEKRRVRRT